MVAYCAVILGGILGIKGIRIEAGIGDSTKNPGGSSSFFDHVYLLNNIGYGIEFAAETFGDVIFYRLWYNNVPTTNQKWKKFSVSVI